MLGSDGVLWSQSSLSVSIVGSLGSVLVSEIRQGSIKGLSGVCQESCQESVIWNGL